MPPALWAIGKHNISGRRRSLVWLQVHVEILTLRDSPGQQAVTPRSVVRDNPGTLAELTLITFGQGTSWPYDQTCTRI